MTATAIRFNSNAQRHAYEQGLAEIRARLEAARQQRALAAIDTRAIVRDSAREAVAGLKRLRAKQASSKQLATKSPPRAAVKPTSGTLHRFCCPLFG